MDPVNATANEEGVAAGGGACGCGGRPAAAPSYVYALGRVDARLPSLGLEKELLQAIGRTDTRGRTDRQAMHAALSRRENLYLARQICWVFTVEGLDAYVIQPREVADLALLIEALRPAPRPVDVDVLIGARGPLAPPSLCAGLSVPLVVPDQLYSFDVDALIQAIPRPPEIPEESFGPAAEELFHRIMQMADNAGATDEHRALNYLAVHYPAIYAGVARAFGRGAALTSVEARPSRLAGARRILDVIFTFTHRATDSREKEFVRVDVTEEFPFLVTKMSPYYDRDP